MYDQKSANELLKPKYNSTLKIVKQIEDVKASSSTDVNFKINEQQIEKIHEKASSKLNFNNHEPAFDGLVRLQPDEDEFIKYLQAKHGQQVKPQVGQHKNTQQKEAPDLMEFYPQDLIKEYSTIDLDPINKPTKFLTTKASRFIAQEPLRNYFKWN